MVRLSQHSFAGGQMDYELMGRQDYDKYAKAASKLQNFRITKRGALEKRPGILKYADLGAYKGARIVSFAYTDSVGFVLVFGVPNDDTSAETKNGVVAYIDDGTYNEENLNNPKGAIVKLETGASWYESATDISELSFCQVGYKLFIAHRNYHPQILELSEKIENGTPIYTFTLKKVNFGGREDKSKVPKINSASCQRTQIASDQACGTMTEEYKATAVYDGIETIPCDAYYQSGVGNQATEAPSWHGDFKPKAYRGNTTTYYLPWTTSQSITLAIGVPEGADEARLYKKSFGVFGLIGVTNISEGETITDKAFTTAKSCLKSDGTVNSYIPKIGIVNKAVYTLTITISDDETKIITATANDYECDFGEDGYECKWSASSSDTKGSITAPNIEGKFNITRTYVNPLSGWTFVDKNFTPDTGITPPEPLEDFCKGAGNYPGTVCYSQQRLIWASTKNDPNRVWMSQVGDFYTYSPHERMVTDDPIDFELPIRDFPYIRHIKEMKDIIVFTDAAEWVIDSASTSAGITFETVRARAHGNIGCDKKLQPIACNNLLLFAERSGRAVRTLSYSAAVDGIGSEDVSILSSSIFEKNPIVDWAYQQFPYGELWCALKDGTFASFTYMPEQKVAAWTTHKLATNDKVAGFASSRRITETGSESMFALVKTSGDVYYVAKFSETGKYHDVATNINVRPAVESIFTSTYPAIAGDAIGLGQFDIKDLVNVGLRLGKGSVGGEIKCEGGDYRVGTTSLEYEPILCNTLPGNRKHNECFKGADNVADGGQSRIPEIVANIKPTMFNARDGRVTIRQAENAPFSLLMYEADYAVERSGQ